MDFICNRNQCTGCEACINVCSLKAIDMHLDALGFKYPYIKSDVCIDCGKCKKICPQNNEVKCNEIGDFYAGVSFDDKIKAVSSSGGIFSLLAEKIINNGGVVFGAAFDENLVLRHRSVDDLNDLYLLRGSKYVQSEIADCFYQAKKHLETGRMVLFSGTPCQIDGLYSYLSKKYKNLYTIDVLCHGVPSPRVFNEYIQNESETYGKKITSIDFRFKKTGWINYSTNISFEGFNKVIYSSCYLQGFLKNYYLRDSCYGCRYASPNRVGDITLGDFWGYKEKAPAYLEDDNCGISLISVNSKQGEKLFKKIKFNAAIVKKSYEEAARGNPILYTPSKKPVDYETFHEDFKSLNWSSLSEKYFNEVVESPVIISEDTKKYISKPFKQRYYKHLLFCKKQELVEKIRKVK